MQTLKKIEFQLTSACNVRCIYCINDDGQKTKDLPQEVIASIIQALKPQKISFTGGDPLIRLETLLSCISIAKANGCVVQVNTNLELADEKVIRALVDAGLNILHVTFDTLKPKVYTQIRQTKPELLNKVIANLAYAANATTLTVIPEIVPLKLNVRELPEIYNFVSQIGVDGLEIQALILGGRATSELAPLRLELVEQVMEVAQMIGSNEPYLELWCFSCTEFPELFGLQNVRYAPCNCGRELAYIGCDGTIFACNFFYQQKAGNIFEPKTKEPWQNLRDIWQTHPTFQKIRQGCFGEKLCQFAHEKAGCGF
ncbi:MAG: radical SAM protein [Candidatus Parcubacteria bacterium]|nr:radical SAM protein [Candidatus Parcubacteria bacterium]